MATATQSTKGQHATPMHSVTYSPNRIPGTYPAFDRKNEGNLGDMELVHGLDYHVDHEVLNPPKVMYRHGIVGGQRTEEAYEVAEHWLVWDRSRTHSVAVMDKAHAIRLGILLDQAHADEYGINLNDVLNRAIAARGGA